MCQQLSVLFILTTRVNIQPPVLRHFSKQNDVSELKFDNV